MHYDEYLLDFWNGELIYWDFAVDTCTWVAVPPPCSTVSEAGIHQHGLVTLLSHLIEHEDAPKTGTHDQDIEVKIISIRTIGTTAASILMQLAVDDALWLCGSWVAHAVNVKVCEFGKEDSVDGQANTLGPVWILSLHEGLRLCSL